MIHKFREVDLTATFPELNTSPHILVMTDEAHRSQYSMLGANLDKAIPPKLRNIADAFLESRGITVKVEPISILDENFQKEVKTRSRTKTKTAEIEHAIRHHLDVDLDDDPDLQASFAEALRILRSSGITGTRFTRSWRSFASALQTPRKNQPSGFTGRSKCPSSVP
jgi:hypothetical protein